MWPERLNGRFHGEAGTAEGGFGLHLENEKTILNKVTGVYSLYRSGTPGCQALVRSRKRVANSVWRRGDFLL